MKVKELLPGKTERMIIMGQAGAGKSVLGKLIYTSVPRVIVIDPKHEVNLSGARIVKEISQLRGALRNDRVVWRIEPEEIGNLRYINDGLKVIFTHGRKRLVHISELYLMCRGPMAYPAFLQALYCQGRSLEIAVSAESQRPAGVPSFCKSECQKFVKFRLILKRDQLSAAEYMGQEVIEPPEFPSRSVHSSKHSFWFLDIFNPPARELILPESYVRAIEDR